MAGVPTVLRWGRRSAADVMRSYFRHDAFVGPGARRRADGVGHQPGDARAPGSARCRYAMRHVGRVGRPVGGSGALTEALAAAVVRAGGEVRTGATVTGIRADGDRVLGVTLADGTRDRLLRSSCRRATRAARSSSGCRSPPAGAAAMIERWRGATSAAGYESKIDVVLTAEPRLRDSEHRLSSTLTIAPTIAEMDRAAAMLPTGGVLERPALLVNVPSIADPTMAPPRATTCSASRCS